MTSSEIYNKANLLTDKEFYSLFRTLTKEQKTTFASLIQLGDNKKLALVTALANKIN